MITITFTGHISIRRGRITRMYHPTIGSLNRLMRLCHYGPTTELKCTNRSSIYQWHGVSSLNSYQKSVWHILVDYSNIYNQSCKLLYHQANSMNMSLYELPAYKDNTHDLLSLLAVKDCADAIGIHHSLMGTLSPCEHGNIQSKCYTCATMM